MTNEAKTAERLTEAFSDLLELDESGRLVAKKSKTKLHPDLQASMTVTEFGSMVHHPFVISPYIDPDFDDDILNGLYAHNKKQAAEALENGQYGLYVFTHERPYRVDAFSEIAELLDKKEHWSLFSEVWTDSENIYENRYQWHDLLTGWHDDPQLMMDEEDRQYYDKLPDEFTIYRGGVDDTGLSWTLDREIAAWFAKRFKEDHSVFEKRIQKKDALAYLSGRSEHEIIFSN